MGTGLAQLSVEEIPMLTNRVTFSALAFVGLVAVGIGACGSGRQRAGSETQPAATHDVNLSPAPGAVTETENSLTPQAAAPAQTQSVASPASPAAPAAAPRAVAPSPA